MRENDEVETLIDRTGSRVGAPEPSAPSGTSAHTIATTVVMRSEELDRARAFYRLVMIMVAAAAAFMPFVPGPRALRALSMAFIGVSIVGCAIALRRVRDEKRYTPRFVAFMGALLGVVAELTLFYMGLFTAAVMILPIGVYFFGLSESRLAARSTFWTGAICYGALSVGVVVGVLPDLGPMPISALATPWKWFFVVMVQVVFATTYFLARSSRRATETAIARVERANRQIFQKEALLAEARIELDRALRPGEGRYTEQVVDGWKLGELLGRGGMGEVYRADRGGERAAIKLLHPIILSDPSHVKRFEREAELARKVKSPHVARVVGTGTGPGGVPYVAMELLLGKDLAWHLRQTPRLRLSGVVELVDHGAKALAAIRDAGIVHRDIKPQNLVLEEGSARAWKLLDFGVSRLEASGHTLTQGALVGTPAYMAPEQARLQPVDHRADVYSLAAVAYRALTGKPLFAGPDVATVLFHVVHENAAAPSNFSRVPEDVELTLAIGLAKVPEDRFQRAEELAQAFERAATNELDENLRARARKLLVKNPWSMTREAEL
jgi:eukaryotic-like serine/threonine-protein kinase